MSSKSFNWDYIRTITLEYKDKLVGAHVVAIFATLANVPVPLLMPLLVDEVLLNQPGKAVSTLNDVFPESWHGPVLYILVVLLFSLLLRLIAIIFNIIQAKQFSFLSKTIIYRIRENLTRHLQSISMAEYESLGSGTIVTYMTTDLNTLDNFIGSTISRLLVATLTIIGTAIILLWMHWPLGLFILLLNPVVIYFTTLVGKHVKELKKKENTAYEVFQLSLSETLEAIHQIRASNREQHYFSQLIDTAKSVKQHAINFSWKSDAANRFSFVIFLFGFDIFRATAMLMVVYSNLTIGEMLAVFGYLWFMMSPVQEVLGIQYAYYGAKAALDRINRLSHLQQEPTYPHLANPFVNTDTVAIRIENLHFSYNEESAILNGISLKIKKGEKVALVGASGGGKSTLVQVLIGLYPANSGMVYFDDVPIDQIGLNVVRENVVTVLQHPTLFNDTIRSNLTLGRDATEKQLWQALEIAQLDRAISHLDKGLDTIVGRQGMRLSGGQRQRIAIARMIIAEPSVVILDESTSALDSQTERKLHQAMADFLSQRTTIIVAHRLSAVKLADKVYVFEEGQICEQGSHHDLINQQGLYSKLYGEHPQ
ncbi:MAG: ABC transporter ATP-binding protein [Methylococcaceae bacterium]